MSDDLWLVTPSGQRGDGAWIDGDGPDNGASAQARTSSTLCDILTQR